MSNIIDGLQEEISRVRNFIQIYDSIPLNAGMFASTIIKNSIKKAEKAIASTDTTEMLKCYKYLKEYNL